MVNSLKGEAGSFRDIKHSLLMGLPLDRYFAVNAMTRSLPIIKSKKDKQGVELGQ
jgi:hypothetical protein